MTQDLERVQRLEDGKWVFSHFAWAWMRLFLLLLLGWG